MTPPVPLIFPRLADHRTSVLPEFATVAVNVCTSAAPSVIVEGVRLTAISRTVIVTVATRVVSARLVAVMTNEPPVNGATKVAVPPVGVSEPPGR